MALKTGKPIDLFPDTGSWLSDQMGTTAIRLVYCPLGERGNEVEQELNASSYATYTKILCRHMAYLFMVYKSRIMQSRGNMLMILL